jgi:hypothetical protein
MTGHGRCWHGDHAVTKKAGTVFRSAHGSYSLGNRLAACEISFEIFGMIVAFRKVSAINVGL